MILFVNIFFIWSFDFRRERAKRRVCGAANGVSKSPTAAWRIYSARRVLFHFARLQFSSCIQVMKRTTVQYNYQYARARALIYRRIFYSHRYCKIMYSALHNGRGNANNAIYIYTQIQNRRQLYNYTRRTRLARVVLVYYLFFVRSFFLSPSMPNTRRYYNNYYTRVYNDDSPPHRV